MKLIHKLLFLLSILFFRVANAQEIKIVTNNKKSFPKIQTKVAISDFNEPIQASDFKIMDNNKSIPFSFSVLDTGSVYDKNKEKAVLFLIECSYATGNPYMKYIKKGIIDGIANLDPNVKINIAYIKGKSDQGFQILRDTFTNDKSILTNLINNQIPISGDSVADVYTAIYKASELLNLDKTLPNDKLIVLVSAGNYAKASLTSFDDAVQKASEQSITINTLVFAPKNKSSKLDPVQIKKLSDKTTGTNRSVTSDVDIQTSIEYFFRSRESYISKKTDRNYLLTYIISNEQGENTKDIEIQFKGSKNRNKILIKDDVDNSKYMFWGGLLAICCILFAVLYFLIFKSRSKKISTLQEKTKSVISKKPTSQYPQQLTVAFEDKKFQIPLNQNKITIGREEGCSIRLENSNISRQHAIISLINKQLTIEDLNSTNGTFLNGSKINQPTKLNVGDVLNIGSGTITII